MSKKQISITEITGSKYASLQEDGEKVFAGMLDAAKDPNSKILLSFVGTEIVTSLFLHACIAEIYNPEYKLLNLPSRVTAIADNDLVNSMIRREIEDAKDYFSNQELYEIAYETYSPC